MAVEAKEKAQSFSTNHDKCRLALDIADLILSGAALDDGEIVLGSFRAQVKKAKEYYNKLKDWLPEKDVRRRWISIIVYLLSLLNVKIILEVKPRRLRESPQPSIYTPLVIII